MYVLLTKEVRFMQMIFKLNDFLIHYSVFHFHSIGNGFEFRIQMFFLILLFLIACIRIIKFYKSLRITQYQKHDTYFSLRSFLFLVTKTTNFQLGMVN